jgi:hypothetical protein
MDSRMLKPSPTKGRAALQRLLGAAGVGGPPVAVVGGALW